MDVEERPAQVGLDLTPLQGRIDRTDRADGAKLACVVDQHAYGAQLRLDGRDRPSRRVRVDHG